MVYIWNMTSTFVGLLFGIGFGFGMFLIADNLILEMQKDEPDDEFINSSTFKYLMKSIMPIFILIASILVIGPLFDYGYEFLQNYEVILGLDPRIFFVGIILVLSLVLDLAVLITKTPFPLFKLAANTWMFFTLGFLLHILS